MRSLVPLLLALAPALAEPAFEVETIALPEGVPAEVGGLDFAPDGTLFVVLRRGDVFRARPTADPDDFDWQHFATGFHNGCGIHALSRDTIRVSQMAELTEASDTDGDGSADRYRRFAAGWGLSGNYHETNSLCPDGEGGYYLAIGTASHAGPTFRHLLGEYSEVGRRGRNFSAGPWRGWTLHCDAKGKLTPFCSGFRMHNGIHLDPQGRLWAGDNQGDWKAATPLYHLRRGHFYGHPASLIWDPQWPTDKDPLATYRQDLDAYNRDRTRAAVLLPHAEICRSAAEPMTIPAGFPFAGQLLVPDNNGPRLARVMLDEVDGEYQGACTLLLQDHGMRSGNNRVRFSPDGRQLYVGQTSRGWGDLAEGLQRITPLAGEPPFDVKSIAITPGGFQLDLTRPLADSSALPAPSVRSFRYQPRWVYGGEKLDARDHPVRATRGEAPHRIALDVGQLEAGRVYEIRLPALESAAGETLSNRLLYYTANRLR